jgi:MSHA biogenesis protein MshL
MQKLILVTALGAVLAGCASPNLTYSAMESKSQERAASIVQAVVAKPNKPASVREINEAYVDFKRVDVARKRGDVTLRAAGTAFAPLMAEVARRSGYSIVFADNVDATKRVSVDFNQAFAEDVLRTTAFIAGYVAVIDKERRLITVADLATYTFKLPAAVFSTLQASYNVGGNSAGSSSGGSGGSSAGGATLQAQFSVTGKEGSASTTIQKLIADVAGGNAQVTVSEMGFLSVRANAQSLRRVHEFLKKLANDAMTQVDIEASIIEVGLSKDFQMGIQWGKVIQTATGISGLSSGAGPSIGGITQNLASGGAAGDAVNALIGSSANAGIGAFRLGASTASIITALQSFSDVKVVSQPRLFSMNNTPASFFDGTQIPYLGSVQQTAAATAGGSPTVSGTTSFAIDGISFSVVPSVVDKDRVQITLIPVLSTVGTFDKFQLGTGTVLTVPRQSNKQTYMRVLAESGKTLVIGGIRSGTDTKDTSLAVSTGAKSTTKEVVILLRATVVPAPDYDPVVAESI